MGIRRDPKNLGHELRHLALGEDPEVDETLAKILPALGRQALDGPEAGRREQAPVREVGLYQVLQGFAALDRAEGDPGEVAEGAEQGLSVLRPQELRHLAPLLERWKVWCCVMDRPSVVVERYRAEEARAFLADHLEERLLGYELVHLDKADTRRQRKGLACLERRNLPLVDQGCQPDFERRRTASHEGRDRKLAGQLIDQPGGGTGGDGIKPLRPGAQKVELRTG